MDNEEQLKKKKLSRGRGKKEDRYFPSMKREPSQTSSYAAARSKEQYREETRPRREMSEPSNGCER